MKKREQANSPLACFIAGSFVSYTKSVENIMLLNRVFIPVGHDLVERLRYKLYE